MLTGITRQPQHREVIPMSKRSGKVRIGTSGWSYPHWHGPFYPDDLGTEEELRYFAERFATAEINNSFYHLPETATLEHWASCTPASFRFAVKGSRYITHAKKLKDPEEPLSRLIERVDVLGRRLGPILFQLPPNWHVNTDRLEQFLDVLPTRHHYAFEFRDPSWHCDQVYRLLEKRRAAFCIFDMAGHLSPKRTTTRFVYVRLHGPADEAYKGRYDGRTLAGWAGAFDAWARQGRDVWCYFDNDEAAYAAGNARRLADMLADTP